MLRFFGRSFWNVCEYLTSTHTILDQMGGQDVPLPPEVVDGCVAKLESTKSVLEQCGLVVSLSVLETTLRALAKTPTSSINIRNRFSQLSSTVEHELGTVLLFRIEPSRHQYLEKDLFGESVAAGYPSAVFEVAEAGRCLALERYPASIFHLMRVAEVALKVIARKFPNFQLHHRSWEFIIDEILDRVDAMPNDAEKKIELREAALHLREIKHLWRNPGIHVGEDFSPERTQSVYNSVRAFM